MEDVREYIPKVVEGDQVNYYKINNIINDFYNTKASNKNNNNLHLNKSGEIQEYIKKSNSSKINFNQLEDNKNSFNTVNNDKKHFHSPRTINYKEPLTRFNSGFFSESKIQTQLILSDRIMNINQMNNNHNTINDTMNKYQRSKSSYNFNELNGTLSTKFNSINFNLINSKTNKNSKKIKFIINSSKKDNNSNNSNEYTIMNYNTDSIYNMKSMNNYVSIAGGFWKNKKPFSKNNFENCKNNNTTIDETYRNNNMKNKKVRKIKNTKEYSFKNSYKNNTYRTSKNKNSKRNLSLFKSKDNIHKKNYNKMYNFDKNIYNNIKLRNQTLNNSNRHYYSNQKNPLFINFEEDKNASETIANCNLHFFKSKNNRTNLNNEINLLNKFMKDFTQKEMSHISNYKNPSKDINTQRLPKNNFYNKKINSLINYNSNYEQFKKNKKRKIADDNKEDLKNLKKNHVEKNLDDKDVFNNFYYNRNIPYIIKKGAFGNKKLKNLNFYDFDFNDIGLGNDSDNIKNLKFLSLHIDNKE